MSKIGGRSRGVTSIRIFWKCVHEATPQQRRLCSIPWHYRPTRIPKAKHIPFRTQHAPRQQTIPFSRFLSTESTSERECWRCGAKLPRSAVFCPAERGLIQPTYDEATYYDVLLPELAPGEAKFAFDVDERLLRNKFLRLQQAVHPDGYGQKSQTEKLCAEQQSSFINKAYQVLRDPLQRAQYLLELNGVSIEEGESMNDPALLMEVLDARERLEEAHAQSEIEEIRRENEKRMEETIDQLSQAFRDRDLDAAKRLAIQLQYWVNIKKAAQEWIPGKRIEIHH
ncbi:Fe-S protein assembly co-chaperone HscB [Spizellomyces punctatus DAOM BR117]|uniref:Fe-S protein assembly co-chaperone HscB n=1 Tax=Spizellomyces punctatus (strain DAOM BR117) TaxID=645134 RepID=A0A0L0HAL2_SPIPD|nr:Fe-S protein assembly co-chaperone HscB [Spizellomyces punctatus DAOM BR117]KNC97743.1 Fe-S protein assembly co-chaperone HscB [Spizellomyces punctatus DAOM BR117]|eukprot:XP_016605783.1 Fe-S protein assembly co-chaperone HscB [Spizellomyces punctatus DAOM BR117]